MVTIEPDPHIQSSSQVGHTQLIAYVSTEMRRSSGNEPSCVNNHSSSFKCILLANYGSYRFNYFDNSPCTSNEESGCADLGVILGTPV
ncbi:hypothetical protein TNCV_1043761 [Trichonephila clavipes]|nr:hypothetical protein TNCV_1043761 [Trichonephila clavipes]